MSLVPGVKYNSAIDDLVQASLKNASYKLAWIPYEKITDIKSSPMDKVYYAICKRNDNDDDVMMLCLGINETCTPTLVSEFARIYSLPTHKDNDVNQFRT